MGGTLATNEWVNMLGREPYKPKPPYRLGQTVRVVETIVVLDDRDGLPTTRREKRVRVAVVTPHTFYCQSNRTAYSKAQYHGYTSPWELAQVHPELAGEW
jgi:hypothetical protein